VTGPLPCDHCRGVHYSVFLHPPVLTMQGVHPTVMILECAGCGARTAFRASGPVMADAS